MNKNQVRLRIIENYIAAYNTFDIVGMVQDLHESVEFENISNGQITLSTAGLDAFTQQAKMAADFFTIREQKFSNPVFTDDSVEVDIDYMGVIAHDLPTGLKQGDKIEIQGKSIFTFLDYKIIKLRDIS